MTFSVSGFPCIEATRCLVTEVENGMRLTVRSPSKTYETSHVATFTKEKSLKEEWYLHFDVTRSNKKDGGTVRRILQLRHCETNLYLCCDERGRISCTLDPSESSWWSLQKVKINNNSQGTEQDGLSDTSKSALESTDDQYILVCKKYPIRRLCCAKGMEGTGEDYRLIGSKNTGTEPSTWTLRFTSGELTSIVNPVVHHHVRCNLYGKLSITSQTCAWEVFRFTEAGNGDLYISSWIHFTKFLSSDSDGKVYTTDFESKTPGHTERWRVEVPPKSNGLYIRNVATGRYLSVGRKRSEHLWTTTKPNDYAVWHLDAPQLHTYYLTSLFASAQAAGNILDEYTIDPNQFYFRDGVEDMHVSSNKEGPSLSRGKKETVEEWKVEVTPEGYFTFFSVTYEKYLGCNSKGDVHTTTSKGAWTLWEKRPSPYGGVVFKSKEHKRFLAVSKTDKTLETTEEEEKIDLCHSWRIDPSIPRSVSGGTGGYLAGAMGLNVPATMPFAVFGALEAVRSSKISKFSAAHRPISTWKSFVNSDPGSSPSSVAVPLQSSVAIANNHISREMNGFVATNHDEEGSYESPKVDDETNGEKETSDETLKVDDETNDEKEPSHETSKVDDETNGEKESSDETPKVDDEKKSSDEPPKVDDSANDEEGDVI